MSRNDAQTQRIIHAAIPENNARQVDAFDLLTPLPQLRAVRLLDLGAGDGRSFDYAKRVYPDLDWLGLDIEGSNEVRSRSRTDCAFATYDGVNIPYPANHFDVVFSRQVFEHVRYPELVMAQIFRVLRPGGQFIGSVSQLEPFHSQSYWNYTYFGFSSIALDAGLNLLELRPGIDGLTLIVRNFVLWGLKNKKMKAKFQKYFTRSSPLNLLIGGTFGRDNLDQAEQAEFAILMQQIASLIPEIMDDEIPHHMAGTSEISVRAINMLKIRYAGHICFRFEKPVLSPPG